MRLVKQFHYTNIMFDESNMILLSEWEDGNEDMGEDTLRDSIIEMANMIRSYSPRYVIADDSNRKRVYDINVQNWIASALAEACVSVGVKAYAVIMPKEFIAHISTEQTAEEAGIVPFEIKYFNDKNEAIQWVEEIGKEKL